MKRLEAIILNLNSRRALLAAVLFVGLLVVSGQPSYAQASAREFVKGEIIVELKPGASVDALNARFGTRTLHRMSGTNFYRLGTPKNKKEDKWRKRVSKDADVLSASLNPVVLNPINVFARATQNFPDGFAVPGKSQAEYLAQHFELNLSDVRRRSTGAGVLVAVIDTGVDVSHTDIAPHVWSDSADLADGVDNDSDGLLDDFRGWDFIDDDNNPADEPGDPRTTIAGHGTFIAGIIALIAPEAKVLPVRAFRLDGTSDAFTVASAIKYAADHGAHVINLSFGSPDDSSVLHDAVLYARARGSVLIAAMGNENANADSRPQFPAGWKEDAMGVAAIDLAGRRAAFSNYGSAAAVSAPGVRIISTYTAQSYAMWSGTSFAAPFAAAEAALILQDDLRKPDTRQVIENTADSIDGLNPGFAGMLGRGRVNPLRALQSIQPVTVTHSETALRPTGVEPSAAGEAEITVTSVEQEFEIDVVGLTARAAYRIVVDGQIVLDATGNNNSRALSSPFGNLKIEFSTRASSNHEPLPAALNPVTGIRHVEVRDASDRVVLQGDFGVASGGGGQSVEKKANLVSTGVLPRANGEARAEVEPDRQEFEVRADGLTPGVVYQIIVDGVSIGARTAQSDSDNQGFFRVKFRSDGGGDLPLPASIMPVTAIKHVELRAPAGQVVLQGDFQSGAGEPGDDNGGGDGGSGGGSGGSGGGQSADKEIDLSSTGVEPGAEGRVRVRLNGSREELEIRLEELDRNATYTIVIDGFTLGSFTTDSDGEIRLEYDTNDGQPPPPQLRPVTNIRHIDVINLAGQIVLMGDLPA